MTLFRSHITIGLILVVCLIALTACSPYHYTQINGDTISLYFTQKNANEVLFASSIDQFKTHPANKLEGDTWEVVINYEREFEYFYIVDGTVVLPDCQLTIDDDFGSKNCLFASEM